MSLDTSELKEANGKEDWVIVTMVTVNTCPGMKVGTLMSTIESYTHHLEIVYNILLNTLAKPSNIMKTKKTPISLSLCTLVSTAY